MPVKELGRVCLPLIMRNLWIGYTMSGNLDIKIKQILGNCILWVRMYRFLGIIPNISLVPIYIETSDGSGDRAMRFMAVLYLEDMMSMWHFTLGQVKLDNCKKALSSRH